MESHIISLFFGSCYTWCYCISLRGLQISFQMSNIIKGKAVNLLRCSLKQNWPSAFWDIVPSWDFRVSNNASQMTYYVNNQRTNVRCCLNASLRKWNVIARVVTFLAFAVDLIDRPSWETTEFVYQNYLLLVTMGLILVPVALLRKGQCEAL